MKNSSSTTPGVEAMKSVQSTRQFGVNHFSKHRLSVVAGACALALGASLAHAQTPTIPTTTYSLALTPYSSTGPTAATAFQTLANDNYMIWVTSPQQNSGPSAGTVATSNALMNIALTGGGATPASLTNNSATSTAAGNQNTTTVALSNITKGAGNLDGIGTLATQVQLIGGTVADVTGTIMKITESGMAAAPATITGNTLAASTTVNRSDTTVSGAVPVGYVSGNAGSIGVSYTAAGTALVDTSATTTASVNLNTFQTNLDAPASASVTASAVQLDITDTSGTSPNFLLDQPLSVSSNTLSAKLEVNKSSNVLQATAGSSAFTGSVGVTNVQTNVITNTGGSTSTVSGSSITSDLSRTASGTTTLTGALTQSSNTISANVSGNSVGDRNAAGNILAGNAILLTSGADLAGSGSTTTNLQTSGISTVGSTTQADLVMLNLQRNDNTNLTSSVTGGLITARVDNVTTGSITLNSNNVASSAEGNLAGNLIQVVATNSTATAAAANVQANSGTPVLAENLGSLVTANVGDTGATVNGTVSLNQNSLSATASGNASATNVVMLASNLTAQENSAASAASVSVAAGSTTATAGLSATNLQSNISSATVPNDITAQLSGDRVAALFTTDGSTTVANVVALTGAAVSLDQNALKATATGNSASTGVTLTGAAGAASNATVQAAVGNSQINDSTSGGAVMAVSSTMADSGVSMLGGATTTSQLSVSSNTLASSATGSSATNTLAANVTNLTVGQNLLAADAASVSTSNATSTAALGLASVQINEATVTASNTATVATTPFAGVQVSSAVGSQLTASGNQASASSTGNSVDNTVQVIATTLASTTGGANAIAALSNLQSNAVTGTASALVGASGTASTIPIVGLQVNGAVTDSSGVASTLTVADNSVSAKALGNTGSNQLAVSGTTLTSTAPTVATGLSSTATTSGNVTSEFSLVNSQQDAVSSGRTADATNVVVGINTTSLLSDSNLTVANNTVSAEARNNQISNAASLTGFATLTTSAGVLNVQDASTAVTATVTGASTGVVTNGALTNASVTIDQNAIQGLAVGSSAGNSLSVSAAVLAGNPKTTQVATEGVLQTGVSTTTATGITQTADFSLANSQNQTAGLIEAKVTGTQTFNNAATGAVAGSQLTVSGNAVQAVAQSLSGSNALALSGTTSASATAALGNLQASTSAVEATITTATQGAILGTTSLGTSQLTVSGNTIKAMGMGASVDNSLSATASVLSGNPVATALQTGYTGTTPTGITQRADFALSSSQNQSGAVSATVTSGTQTISDAAAAAVTGSQLTLSGNTVQSTAQSLSASNALNLSGTTSLDATSALANLQVSTSVVTADTTAQQGISSGLTSVGTSSLTVSGNSAQAVATGASATNVMRASAAVLTGNPVGTTATETGVSTANQSAGTLAQTADFSLVNNQSQKAGAVSADVTGMQGIALSAAAAVATSPLSVTGNSVQGIAQSLSATNVLALSGTNSANASASVGNLQVSDSVLTTTTTATQGVIGATVATVGTAVAPSNITVSGNVARALAVGTSASNALSVDSANLSGNSIGEVANTGGSSYNSLTPAVTTADFAVSNVQNQSGALTATLLSTQIVDMPAASVTGGAITVSGNTAASVAQANSAGNNLTLTGANQSGLTGALLSVQTGTASVAATQAATDGVNTFAVKTGQLNGTAATVSSNSLLVSAGMNEAFNTQTVSGATLAADGARGNDTTTSGLTGVTALTSATSGAAFSVQNVQSGTTGEVSAIAQPELIGISAASSATSSKMTVSDNTVTAKANVNYASNALNLQASNTLAGSGAVNNVQTSDAGGTGVSATIGGSTAATTTVGIAPPVPTITSSTATVSGNVLNAQAGGNTSLNTLSATALNGISDGGVTGSSSSATGPTTATSNATFAVLNYQGNNSAISASVQYASIGMGSTTGQSYSTALVQNNAVVASGYGNTASNSLGMSALTGNANAASAGISNVQYNLGAVNASVSNVSIGIAGAGGVTGGQATVSGNSVAAQAVGNSAVNRIVALR